MPFAWVIKRDTKTYKLIKGKDEARAAEDVPRRALVPLTGTARIKGGVRYYQTAKDKTRWLRADDLGIVAEPPAWPSQATVRESSAQDAGEGLCGAAGMGLPASASRSERKRRACWRANRA
jgi:hypothetical protein